MGKGQCYMKIIVWGTGYWANEYVIRKSYHLYDDILAFTDNNSDLWGKQFQNLEIIPPDELKQLEFDRLVVCSTHYQEIKRQIEEELQIDCTKIVTYFELENSIKKELILRYSACQDAELLNVLRYYETYSLNVYGYYDGMGRKNIDQVQYDIDGMPYIFFEGKRMYFPRGHRFHWMDGSAYIRDILFEQGSHSPHLYMKSDDIIQKNMVIVDAGVCEGNFALRYVEEAGKIYLIESDPKWIEALERTFQPYKSKVVICNKYLSNEDTENTVTLDTLIKEPVDILKMDIEGYEVSALEGSAKILRESRAYCAICSYHRHYDEQKIKYLLQQYGYQTETSEGYMFFVYDAYREFRKGVVYGIKS